MEIYVFGPPGVHEKIVVFKKEFLRALWYFCYRNNAKAVSFAIAPALSNSQKSRVSFDEKETRQDCKWCVRGRLGCIGFGHVPSPFRGVQAFDMRSTQATSGDWKAQGEIQ
jgi:hypothetical protein